MLEHRVKSQWFLGRDGRCGPVYVSHRISATLRTLVRRATRAALTRTVEPTRSEVVSAVDSGSLAPRIGRRRARHGRRRPTGSDAADARSSRDPGDMDSDGGVDPVGGRRGGRLRLARVVLLFGRRSSCTSRSTRLASTEGQRTLGINAEGRCARPRRKCAQSLTHADARRSRFNLSNCVHQALPQSPSQILMVPQAPRNR